MSVQKKKSRARHDDKCFNCGKPGHWHDDCPSPRVSSAWRRVREEDELRNKCWNCEKQGHWRKDCPMPPRVPSTADWLPDDALLPAAVAASSKKKQKTKEKSAAEEKKAWFDALPAKLRAYYDEALGKWRFPETDGNYQDDTLEEVCRFCGEWTTHRYHYLHGCWKSGALSAVSANMPVFGQSEVIGEIEEIGDCLPICDNCFEEHGVDGDKTIEVHGGAYHVDYCSRAND